MQTAPPIIEMSSKTSANESLVPWHPLDSVLVYGLLAVLIFGPLAFGAVEVWATSLLELGALGLFLAWAARQHSSRLLNIEHSALYLPMTMFAVIVIIQITFHSSVYAHFTVVEAMKYSAYAIVLFVASQCVRSEKHLKTFALTLAVFGFLFSLFALLQDLTSNGALYWLRKPRFGGTIYGSYVNRNHYAGLMEMLTSLPLVMCLSRYFPAPQRILLGFMAALMGTTILLSGSRAGAAAFIAQIIFLALFSLTRGRGKAFNWGLAAFFVLVVGLLFWLDGSRALDRWNYLHVKDEVAGGRLAITKDAVRMAADHPLLGFGLGTFATAYPHYRSFYTDFYINEAHNDFVQVLVETGILGAVAMLWFIFSLYRGVMMSRRSAQSDVRDLVRLGALTACTGLLIHSFFDFNLHVPANAAMFFAMCAIATLPARGGGSREIPVFREEED